jgi:hypothetical protein
MVDLQNMEGGNWFLQHLVDRTERVSTAAGKKWRRAILRKKLAAAVILSAAKNLAARLTLNPSRSLS